jgi:hypothetical protein
MVQKPNITVESSIWSFPERNVYLILKMINHESQDFYYPYTAGFFDPDDFAINNTEFARTYYAEWQGCPSRSTGYHIYSTHYAHIPANGVYESKLNIISLCRFLKYEPVAKDLWVKFAPGRNEDGETGSNIYLTDEPNGEVVGAVYIPVILEKFDLLND